MAGVEIPETVQGRSLMPIIRGEEEKGRADRERVREKEGFG